MDKDKTSTRRVTPEEIAPTVRIANYIQVAPETAWPDRTIPDPELI